MSEIKPPISELMLETGQLADKIVAGLRAENTRIKAELIKEQSDYLAAQVSHNNNILFREKRITKLLNCVHRLVRKNRKSEAELAAEVERLTKGLNTANANHEEYERKYYLELDAKEAAEARAEELKALLRDRESTIVSQQEEIWRLRSELAALKKLLEESPVAEVEILPPLFGRSKAVLKENIFHGITFGLSPGESCRVRIVREIASEIPIAE